MAVYVQNRQIRSRVFASVNIGKNLFKQKARVLNTFRLYCATEL